MENKNTESVGHFREVVEMLIKNSLLLSHKEKEDFIQLLPMLNKGELLELFGLLVNAKENTHDILTELVEKYPDVVKQLSHYQKKALKDIFSFERNVMKTKLIK